jgi:phosphoglycolate phosphatase-like HAD superfamily hydrolase
MSVYVFDFDGVVGDTFDAYSDFLANFMRVSPEKARAYVLEHSLNNRKQSLIKSLIKNFYMQKFELYLRAQSKQLLFPDVLESIEQLNGPKYIVSRNHVRIVKDILMEQQIIFKDIYGYNNAKSKVAALLDIIDKEKIHSEEVVFVSDTIGDYREAIEILEHSQIHLVNWGFNTKQVIQEFNPDIQLIETPLQLSKLN